MAVRIRVHPGGTVGAPNIGGLGGYGGYGGGLNSPAWAQAYYGQKAQQTKQRSQVQLRYQRAIMQERLETAKLQTAMSFGMGGIGGMGAGMVNPYMMPTFAPAMLGGMATPMLFGGSGGFLGGLLGSLI